MRPAAIPSPLTPAPVAKLGGGGARYRVAHLGTTDRGGGAADAVARLAVGCRARGHTVQHFVHEAASGASDTVVQLPIGQPVRLPVAERLRAAGARRGWWRRHAEHRPVLDTAFSVLSSPRGACRDFAALHAFGPDVVQLNWTAGMLDWPEFFGPDAGQPAVPIVWRLADMVPFTGMCHYDQGCRRFASGCGQCPQARASRVIDRSASWLALKATLIQRVPAGGLEVVCQSEWMRRQAETSPVFAGRHMHLIRNGVDASCWYPIAKRAARRELGLPEAGPLMVVATFPGERRKGAEKMLKVIEASGKRDEAIVLWGAADEGGGRWRGYRVLPFTSDPQQLRLIGSVGDVLVFPSLQDNCPNVVLQCMACGTPVICFDGSGTHELIVAAGAGVSVPVGDFAALLQAGRSLAASKPVGNGLAFGQKASEIFDEDRTVDQYLAVYASIVSRQHTAAGVGRS